MDKPIRILHVLGRLDRGGAETIVMNLYRNIDRSKIQFDFVKHTDEKCDFDDEIRELGGKIISVPRYTGKNHVSYIKEWKNIFSKRPEYKIIHGHMRSTAIIYLSIAKKYGLTTIAHSHSTGSRGNKIEQLTKNILQFPIRYTADYLFACSDDAGKRLFGKKAVNKENYRIIKNAIDVDNYMFNKSLRNKIRKLLNIEDKFVIGHVGSFTYAKNHEFLLDMFYEVQNQKENAIMLLIGDGDLRKSVEYQIKKLGIKDKVILTGVVSNVNEYLQAMDVFVFPSIYEGFGMALIEAQAAGLNCFVSSNLPKEVFLTDLIYGISIDESTKYWANLIINKMNNLERKDVSEIIKAAGYDIVTSACWLQNFYLELNQKMNKLKVLYWGMSDNLGGIETYLVNLVNVFKNKNIKIDFLSSSKSICFEKEIKELGSDVYHIPSRMPNPFLFYSALIVFFIKRRDYKIVHFFLQSCSSIEPVVVAKLTKHITFVDSQSAYRGKKIITRLLDSINKEILPYFTDEMLAISSVSGRSMFKTKKFKIVKSAINPVKYRYNPLVREKYRNKFGLSNKKVIGHVGRFVHEKNHSFLIDIFQIIHANKPNTVLLLIGDGPLMKEIKEKARKLGLSDSIIFTERRTDIPQLMQAMDVFVFPSLFEGLGRVVIEAQAAGLKTIVSDRIPDEVLITDLVKKIPLNKSEHYWSNEIIKSMDSYDRMDKYDVIYNSGYDIKSSAKQLYGMYQKYNKKFL
jgi:glycosyltransferase involved in cell wall biosynthesis